MKSGNLMESMRLRRQSAFLKDGAGNQGGGYAMPGFNPRRGTTSNDREQVYQMPGIKNHARQRKSAPPSSHGMFSASQGQDDTTKSNNNNNNTVDDESGDSDDDGKPSPEFISRMAFAQNGARPSRASRASGTTSPNQERQSMNGSMRFGGRGRSRAGSSHAGADGLEGGGATGII